MGEQRPNRDRSRVAHALHQGGHALKNLRTVDMATIVVKELMQRSELSRRRSGSASTARSCPTLDWLNIAREVVLRSGLPEGHRCVQRLARLRHQLAGDDQRRRPALAAGSTTSRIAGGADSMSDIRLGVGKKLTRR